MPSRLMPLAMMAIMGLAVLWITREKNPHPNPGESLPVLTAPMLLASASPKETLLVNFWATWCEPCVRELPMLVKFNEKWAPKGVRVVLVNLDGGLKEDKIRHYTDLYKATPLTARKSDNEGFFETLGIEAPQALPYTALIRQDPRKTKTWFGERTWEQLELELTGFLK